MYGNAAVMGLSPADVDRMSLAQWIAVSDGWARAHDRGEDKPEPPTAEEYWALVSRRR